jgi:hypothetical protein
MHTIPRPFTISLLLAQIVFSETISLELFYYALSLTIHIRLCKNGVFPKNSGGIITGNSESIRQEKKVNIGLLASIA